AGDVCLFPTPLESPADSKADAPKYKDLKKCKYVSRTVFNTLIAGKPLTQVFPKEERIVKKVLLQGGKVLLDESEANALPKNARHDEKIWTIEKRPRVAVGRAASNSQIYHTGQTVFQDSSGLWFAVRWLNRDDALARVLAETLADLADAGLGGKRSVGFGHCRIYLYGTLELPEANGAHWVSLSRYLPRADEMNALRKGVAYAVESVGGWVQSPVKKSERRRAVRMIAEGSVLGRVPRAVPGQVVDVRPNYDGKQQLEHPVWRSGLALSVGTQTRAPREEA
ncbi:MAG: type III-A CRISPR-associated RAMP protein Csm4, partial [Chloroflexota bacterium]|nr:type III-A CRISPR-associated RAMP protein Csm4 [Chloroflexota bacterium]